MIKIDCREKDLITKIKSLIKNVSAFQDLQMEVVNLPLGDIVFEINGKEKWIVERKRLTDLLSSLKDGRYEEQSYRLSGYPDVHNHNIVYLIEGNIETCSNSFRCRMEDTQKYLIYSTIFSLNYYKGFSVLRTFSIDETALFLCQCAKKLLKGEKEERKEFFSNMSCVELCQTHIGSEEGTMETDTTDKVPTDKVPSDKDYAHVVKKVKCKNITCDNIDEIMLCQIPGISASMAVVLMKQYHSLLELIEQMKMEALCLEEFRYESNGKSKKLNKTVITNLRQFLLKKKDV